MVGITRAALRSYEDLISWQRSVDLTLACYRFAKTLPVDERYGLTSQLKRAATSIASNIAEGYGRRTRSDYLHFLSIARGSLMEVEAQLLVAQRLAYGRAEDRDAAIRIAKETERLLKALMRSLGDTRDHRSRAVPSENQPSEGSATEPEPVTRNP